ncbi:MAG: transglycosylase SLT domain-containing protein, partial [Polyangiaceae bacterium]|nr:transglycosylase SLT domain-containing protein [Polyangiaceae bacterium]
MRRARVIAASILALSLASPAQAAGAKKQVEKKPHQQGRPPRSPDATLPPSSILPEANQKVRAAIAERPAPEKKDDELSSLSEADRVLFPRSVRGLSPGWSFSLPEMQQAGVQVGVPGEVQTEDTRMDLAQADRVWLSSLTLPDLPVHLDQRVVTYLKFYRDSHRGRTIAAIWARKSGRYISAMKAELRRAGLPTDLVWLSMIESGHNPTIRSPAGAVGLWQFMPSTGRMYGLTVD